MTFVLEKDSDVMVGGCIKLMDRDLHLAEKRTRRADSSTMDVDDVQTEWDAGAAACRGEKDGDWGSGAATSDWTQNAFLEKA